MSDYTRRIGRSLYDLAFKFILGLVAGTISIAYGGLNVLLIWLVSHRGPFLTWYYGAWAATSSVALGMFIMKYNDWFVTRVLIACLQSPEDPKVKKWWNDARTALFKQNLRDAQRGYR